MCDISEARQLESSDGNSQVPWTDEHKKNIVWKRKWGLNSTVLCSAEIHIANVVQENLQVRF